MSSTDTAARTLAGALTEANPNDLPDALRKVDLGVMLFPIKATLTNAPVAATVTLDPPAASITSVRVSSVAGAAGAAGPRQVTDAAGTPSATVCTLSDDGVTLTFEGTVTIVIVNYMARSAEDGDELFGTQGA